MCRVEVMYFKLSKFDFNLVEIFLVLSMKSTSGYCAAHF